ncbi:MAG TPA: phosphoenolpyruvate carboxylase, partial [Allocoleopsis sp.]
MSSTFHSSDDAYSSVAMSAPEASQTMAVSPTSELFPHQKPPFPLRERLKVVEDLWESVLQQECGQELVDLLNQLRAMCSPEGQAANTLEAEVLKVIEKLDLNEAIRAARAFALYFQLINIVEQHYEQRGQQQQYRAAYEGGSSQNSDRAQELIASLMGERTEAPAAEPQLDLQANLLEKSLQETPPPRREMGTFHGLFPKLRELNVPPQHIQRLIDQLDVRLVFTAHPTEIVRHTIRDKQRRIAKILRQLDRIEESGNAANLVSSWELEALREQLTEEIRLWWRTDELHQFKPTVLDEVDYTLHYFQEVLFDVIPQLYQRFKRALDTSFPRLRPPQHSFCKFGSWVGSDRDGNPSVTPQITWQTACYQRNLVLEKYLQSVRRLTNLLSLSLHWCDVLPDLLESLEQDQMQLPDVYDRLAIRYRQEPYRLKLA